MRLLKFFGIVLVVLAVAAAAVCYGIYRRNDQEVLTLDGAARQTREVLASGGSYVELKEGVTHFELSGPADAQTVVLVHGFSVPYYIWDPTFTALTSAGFRVLRYDLFGRGWSDRPDATYDPEFFDQQLLQLLDALGIRGPVDIAGVSMGGPIAVNFAVRHPGRVRRVALFDPAYGPAVSLPWKLRAPLFGEYQMCVKIAPTLAAGQREDFVHPERYPDYFEDYLPQMRYRGFRHALLSSLRNFISRDSTRAFQQLGASGKPVLLVWGRADQDVPFAISDDVRKAVPQAEFHPIDDAAHVPFYEHPEIVNPVLIDFLRR